MDDWPLERESFDAVCEGLERTYRRGRRDLREARAEPSVEALHEWRKRVKELWYHHTLLRELWPPVMAATGDEAHALADRLGDDHDLAVLAGWVAEHAEAGPELSRGGRAAARGASGRRFRAGRADLRREAVRVRPAPEAALGRTRRQ